MTDGLAPNDPTQGLVDTSNRAVSLNRDAKPKLKFVQVAVIQESGKTIALRDDGQLFITSRNALSWERYPPCPQD